MISSTEIPTLGSRRVKRYSGKVVYMFASTDAMRELREIRINPARFKTNYRISQNFLAIGIWLVSTKKFHHVFI
ncbi:MAG: hypothetical protein ABIR24_07660 [Verrucomicrobiota bacterium]